MRTVSRVILAATLAGLANQAVAREIKPNIPAPSSSWNVDWSEDVCTLRRTYGDPATPDVIWIERFGPTNNFELTIISDKLTSTRDIYPVFITWGSQPSSEIHRLMRGKTKTGRTSLFFGIRRLRPLKKNDPQSYKWEQPDLIAEARVTQLAVQVGHAQVVLKLGPFAKALAALRSCTSNLVKVSGLNPVEQQALATLPQPIGNPGDWMMANDYPLEQLAKYNEAVVRFRLMVDATGKPTSCRILRSFSNDAFNQVTCDKLMKRAHFEPARSKEGESKPSFFISTVRFVAR